MYPDTGSTIQDLDAAQIEGQPLNLQQYEHDDDSDQEEGAPPRAARPISQASAAYVAPQEDKKEDPILQELMFSLTVGQKAQAFRIALATNAKVLTGGGELSSYGSLDFRFKPVSAEQAADSELKLEKNITPELGTITQEVFRPHYKSDESVGIFITQLEQLLATGAVQSMHAWCPFAKGEDDQKVDEDRFNFLAGPALNLQGMLLHMMERYYRAHAIPLGEDSAFGGPDLDVDELLLQLFNQWDQGNACYRKETGEVDVERVCELLHTTEVILTRKQLRNFGLLYILEHQYTAPAVRDFYQQDKVNFGILPFARRHQVKTFLENQPALLQSQNPKLALGAMVKKEGEEMDSLAQRYKTAPLMAVRQGNGGMRRRITVPCNEVRPRDKTRENSLKAEMYGEASPVEGAPGFGKLPPVCIRWQPGATAHVLAQVQAVFDYHPKKSSALARLPAVIQGKPERVAYKHFSGAPSARDLLEHASDSTQALQGVREMLQTLDQMPSCVIEQFGDLKVVIPVSDDKVTTESQEAKTLVDLVCKTLALSADVIRIIKTDSHKVYEQGDKKVKIPVLMITLKIGPLAFKRHIEKNRRKIAASVAQLQDGQAGRFAGLVSGYDPHVQSPEIETFYDNLARGVNVHEWRPFLEKNPALVTQILFDGRVHKLETLANWVTYHLTKIPMPELVWIFSRPGMKVLRFFTNQFGLTPIHEALARGVSPEELFTLLVLGGYHVNTVTARINGYRYTALDFLEIYKDKNPEYDVLRAMLLAEGALRGNGPLYRAYDHVDSRIDIPSNLIRLISGTLVTNAQGKVTTVDFASFKALLEEQYLLKNPVWNFSCEEVYVNQGIGGLNLLQVLLRADNPGYLQYILGKWREQRSANSVASEAKSEPEMSGFDFMGSLGNTMGMFSQSGRNAARSAPNQLMDDASKFIAKGFDAVATWIKNGKFAVNPTNTAKLKQLLATIPLQQLESALDSIRHGAYSSVCQHVTEYATQSGDVALKESLVSSMGRQLSASTSSPAFC